MEKWYKLAVVLETATIVILSLMYVSDLEKQQNSVELHYNEALVSPRISSGLLEPKNYLILNLDPLKDSMDNYIRQNNLNASVYVTNLRDGASFGINSNTPFEPASLNKLIFAMVIAKKIERHEYPMDFDTMLEVRPEDRDSHAGILYKTASNEMSVKDLLYAMLSDSDNTAFNVLSREVTPEQIVTATNYFGFYHVENGQINSHQVTVRSVSNIFRSLYLSTFLETNYSEFILDSLANSTLNVKKYANLPNDVVVAHKYGNYYTNRERIFADCGIIYYGEKRFLYCIMIDGLDGDDAMSSIGEMVNGLFSYITTIDKENRDSISKDI